MEEIVDRPLNLRKEYTFSSIPDSEIVSFPVISKNCEGTGVNCSSIKLDTPWKILTFPSNFFESHEFTIPEIVPNLEDISSGFTVFSVLATNSHSDLGSLWYTFRRSP